MSLVNGLGTLRNRLSDSHGRGGRVPVKPSPRHANLAVDMVGALACFWSRRFCNGTKKTDERPSWPESPAR